jgi:hypothetical protein
MTITLEMFKAVCTFDQITPQFLHLIFGFGRKARSFDEDYMACYHQFSFNEKTKSETLVEESGEGHNLSDNQKTRVKSYGWCILFHYSMLACS